MIARLLKYTNGQMNMFDRCSGTFTYGNSDTAHDTINSKRSPSLPIKVACIAVKFQTKNFSSTECENCKLVCEDAFERL